MRGSLPATNISSMPAGAEQGGTVMFARVFLIFASLFASAASAAPTIDPQFGTHAVIQRGKPVVLSGTAAPGEHIAVSFAGQAGQAVADRAGIWRTTLPPPHAGGPFLIEGNRTARRNAR